MQMLKFVKEIEIIRIARLFLKNTYITKTNT